MKMYTRFACFKAGALAVGIVVTLAGCATDKAFQDAMAKKEDKEAATGSSIMRKDRSSDVIVVSPDALADKRGNPAAPKAGN